MRPLLIWTKLKKTKFYHALNGRDGKEGMLQFLKCIKLSDSTILAPSNNIEPLREFIESWDLDYRYIPMIIPKRLAKKQILER